jgi:hypothetical protein
MDSGAGSSTAARVEKPMIAPKRSRAAARPQKLTVASMLARSLAKKRQSERANKFSSTKTRPAL